jgi:hypothetical protein
MNQKTNTHGGARKRAGRPKTEKGTLILISIRIKNLDERPRINQQLTPAERTAVLLQAIQNKEKSK